MHSSRYRWASSLTKLKGFFGSTGLAVSATGGGAASHGCGRAVSASRRIATRLSGLRSGAGSFASRDLTAVAFTRPILPAMFLPRSILLKQQKHGLGCQIGDIDVRPELMNVAQHFLLNGWAVIALQG